MRLFPASISVFCVSGALRGQRRMFGLLELKLEQF